MSKHCITYQNGVQVAEKTVTFVWDGWDLLYERHQLPSGLTTLERKYLWGPDLADGAAGGAGGLLLIGETKGNTTTNYIPIYDGTGHVVALTDINKNLHATYAYGPFGEKIYATGDKANSNPWRWATKYLDEETGLYYFGHRFYDPITGQWLSREPLGESESVNLYAYCQNDPVNYVDVRGLKRTKTVVSEDKNRRFRQNENGEWEVRLVHKEKGFFGGWEVIGEKWDPVSKHRNWKLRGYSDIDIIGGKVYKRGAVWQAAAKEWGMEPDTVETEGVLLAGGSMLAMMAPVAAPTLVSGTSSAYTYGGQWLGSTAATYGPGILANPVVQKTATYGGTFLATGTFYGMSRDSEFAADVIAMEYATPGIPGEGLAYGLGGWRMIGQDASAGLANAWQRLRPAAEDAVEGALHQSGGLAYAVSPNNGSTGAYMKWWFGSRGTVHGNSMAAQGSHDVYVTRELGTGKLLHFGETGRGYMTRFAEHQRFFAAQGIKIEINLLNTVQGKAAAKALETRYIQIYEKVFGARPPYNLSYH